MFAKTIRLTAERPCLLALIVGVVGDVHETIALDSVLMVGSVFAAK